MARHPLGQDCTRIKNNGEPCKNRAIIGATVCRFHGGAAPQVRKRAAERIAEAANDAAALLVKFMEDPDNEIKVRTQIAQDLLNRAGFAGKQAVDVTVSRFEQLVETGGFLVDLGEVTQDETRALEQLATPVPKVALRKRRKFAR